MNKFLIFKIVSVLIAAYSQVLLKKSANMNHDSFIKEYLNPRVIIAYVIFAISVLLSIVSLRGISIGFSAIIESLNYILVPILGYLFFKERMNKKQVLGIGLIVIGIIIYSI